MLGVLAFVAIWALIAQMESVLDPLMVDEVIDDYEIVIPLLTLLDKDPNSLTTAEGEEIKTARTERLVKVLALIHYAAAIHRLSITLKFE